MVNKCIVIAGQTASGKSKLAVDLALYLKKIGIKSEIISADSRAVYIGGDLISAKINKKEMRGIPHHMISIAKMNQDYTVADYKKEASKIIKKLLENNIIPIICGGTGLYIDNLVFKKIIPEVPPNLALRQKLEKLTIVELFKKLNTLDPLRAQNIDPKNKRRIIRALEIIEKLGNVPSQQKPELAYDVLFIGLMLPKEILQTKISKRTEQRMLLGMHKEINDIVKNQKVSYARIKSFGMEYKWLTELAEEKISKEECIKNINKDTISYAKRQITWFKKNKLYNWIDMSAPDSIKKAQSLVKDFINK